MKNRLDTLNNTFLYLGLDKAGYQRLEPRLQKENRWILQLMSVVVFFIQAAMVVVNSLSSFLNTSTLFYVTGALVEAAIFILCITVAKKYPRVMPYLVELNMVIVYALSIGLGTIGSSANEPTVTFFVVMIFVPLIFIMRPVTFTLTNVIATVVFLLMDRFKEPDVFSRDLTNAIVYVVLGTAIATWLTRTRVRSVKLLCDIEEARQDLQESYGIVESLSWEYDSLILADRETLGMSLIRSKEGVTSPAAVRLFRQSDGYKNFIRDYIAEFVAYEDRERMSRETAADTVFAEIENPGIYTVTYLRVDDAGKTAYYQIAFASAGSGKDSRSFVIGFRNVDAIVRKEQEQKQLLKDALDAAEHANRAKTAFLNNMSHDIRTPMNAIIGFTALAGAHIDNREQVQDYLKKITTSGQHLLSLINDVLDMSRIESGKMKIDEKPVRLPDVLHDLRNIIQVSVAAKQLNLFIDTVDVVNEEVICDSLRLNQVLLNLVSNAIKYTQAGGYVSIRLVQKPSSNPKYANYEFRVKDNGIGMSKEFAGHVFDSFSREETATVNKIQGTGLGMAITKNIVDMMGGTIGVETEKGKGSEFIVSLPLKLSGEKTVEDVIPDLQNVRALVVDDDSACCVSVGEMLGKIGLRADWTLSGREAVLRAEVAKKQGDSYGVFIVDLMMPDMNGIETVRRIRHVIGEDVPIIVLTAYDWSDVQDEAREAGVTAFCSKPIFMSELREALSKPFRPRETAEEPSAPEKADFAGHRILLVEDNELNREIAATLLTDLGLTVDEAEDGSVAVRILSDAKSGTYDLVLMDIQMPVLNGYEATKQIRALKDPERAKVPIVAMTANAFEEDKRLAMDAGMDDHLAKPIDIASVLTVLKKYIG